jgi:hypothetical protein
MPSPIRRVARACAVLLTVACACAASATSLQIEFETAAMPAQIELCRTPVARGLSEHAWAAFIDVDQREDSGEAGADVLVIVSTPVQPLDCVPTSMPFAASLSVETLRWDADAAEWTPADIVAQLQVDPALRRLRVGFDEAAVTALALADRSRVYALSQAIYPDGYDQPAAALDVVDVLQLAGMPARTDPALDLENCGEACDAFFAWYQLADLRAVRLQGELPVAPAFGEDTLRLGITLDALPAQLTLCPDGRAELAGFADFAWNIAIDVDGRRDTGEDLGDEVGGVDLYVVMNTGARSADCAAQPLATRDAIQAGVFAWEPDDGGFASTDVALLLRVDTAAAMLMIDLDRADPRLQAISATTRFSPRSMAIDVALPTTEPPDIDLILDSTGPEGFAFDGAPSLTFFDGSGDLECASCDPFGASARAVDIVRFQADLLGPVAFDPAVFGDGFESR